MRRVKNITVSVPPEVYRDARHLAADYDTTVSAFVAWLLPRLRTQLERTHFPKGGPKTTLTPALTPGGETAKTDCAAVPSPLTSEDSAACGHRAAPVQPQCNCTPALNRTQIKA